MNLWAFKERVHTNMSFSLSPLFYFKDNNQMLLQFRYWEVKLGVDDL
jgi:hypothetical protein